MFFNCNEFKFTENIESNWLVIKQELTLLQEKNSMPWPERFLYEKGWGVFGLYSFGKRLDRNCDLCPQTSRLVDSIPGITTAGFSSLAPGTHIKPHVGASEDVLRCHLGLIIPDNCSIRVGDRTET